MKQFVIAALFIFFATVSAQAQVIKVMLWEKQKFDPIVHISLAKDDQAYKPEIRTIGNTLWITNKIPQSYLGSFCTVKITTSSGQPLASGVFRISSDPAVITNILILYRDRNTSVVGYEK